MAQHRTLMEEPIDEILHKTVLLDSARYRVKEVKHYRNGVFRIRLDKFDGTSRRVEVLVENGMIIYVD